MTFILSLFILSCDHGLKPSGEKIQKPGFGGTIYFKGSWPDTVYEVRVVAFRIYPPEDIANEILQGRAKFTDELPLNVPSTDYKLFTEPGEWQYVITAMRYGEDILKDWMVIGVYDETPEDTIPTPVFVPENKFVRGIDMVCDFENPPPQPFDIKFNLWVLKYLDN